jgi:hypothetical protein
VCIHGIPPAAGPIKDSGETVFTFPTEPATGNLLDNATPPPGTTLSVTGFKLPGNPTAFTPGPTPITITDPVTGTVDGTIVVQPDGTYTFTPAPGFVGPVPPITYTVTASDGQAKDSVLGITVRPQLLDNNEELTTPANTPVTTNVLANVVPPPGTTAGVTSFMLPGSTQVYPAGPGSVAVRDPANPATIIGSLVMQPNGTATFTPANGFTGPVPQVTYTVTSSDGQTNPSALNIDVAPGPNTLLDGDEARTTTMGVPTSGNVLDNVKPAPGTTVAVDSFTVQGSTQVYRPGTGPVTLTVADGPLAGTVAGTITVAANGSYTFNPAPGYVGPAPAVAYVVKGSDGQTNPSELTIDVLPRECLPEQHARRLPAFGGCGCQAQLGW